VSIVEFECVTLLCTQTIEPRGFKFKKRRQLFIGTHNEPFSVAMRISNPDCSPVGINGSNAAPTPTGLLRFSATVLKRFRFLNPE